MRLSLSLPAHLPHLGHVNAARVQGVHDLAGDGAGGSLGCGGVCQEAREGGGREENSRRVFGLFIAGRPARGLGG